MKDLLNIFREKKQPSHPIMTKLSQKMELHVEHHQFRLRFGEESDIPNILELERKAYRGYLAWQMKDFVHDWKNNPYCVYLVLELESHGSAQLVGMINGRFRQRGGHISHVIIDPEFQGQGLGKVLVEHFLRAAQLLNVPAVTLEVRESNYRAQQLYTGFGFKRRNIKRFYYSDNHEDAIEMIYERGQNGCNSN